MSAVPSASVSRLVKQAGAANVPSPDFAKHVERLLAEDRIVAFYEDHPSQPFRHAFSLKANSGTVRIGDAKGRHLGTFASVPAAICYGWEVAGR